MAVNRISTDLDITGLPFTIGTGTPLILDASGSLYSTDATAIIHVDANATALINGSVFAANGTGFSVGDHGTLTISAAGTISASVGATMTASFGTVVNNGSILGFSNGIAIAAGANGNAVTNTGFIQATADVAILAAGNGSQVVNSGTLVGYNAGIATEVGAGSAILDNSGVINGYWGVRIENLSTTLVNSGLVQGAAGAGGVVVVQSAADMTVQITNAGTINGEFGVHAEGDGTLHLDISNSGTIQSSYRAIDFSSSASSFGTELASIHNGAGGIIESAGATAILVSGAFAGSNIVNAGTISAAGSISYGVVDANGALRLTNTGLIAATDLASGIAVNSISTIGATIVNFGTISGATALELSAGLDYVRNGGTLHGTVDLGAGNDIFDGRGGHSSGPILGGIGNDLFILTDAQDVVSEALLGGNDTVRAWVDYTLATGSEVETLTLMGNALRGIGNEFSNHINGNDQDNRLSGLAGADTISGGTGDDRISGGTENDSLSGGDDNDTLFGDDGADSLFGNNGDDVLNGGLGADNLQGAAGNDSLFGGADSDLLFGGDGDDLMNGGGARDTLNGGAGEDTFVYLKLSDSGLIANLANDIITGFVSGSDRIDLSALDAKSNVAGNDAFTFLGNGAFTGVAGQLHYTVAGGNIVLAGDVNGDGVADFQIQLNAIASIALGDLIL